MPDLLARWGITSRQDLRFAVAEQQALREFAERRADALNKDVLRLQNGRSLQAAAVNRLTGDWPSSPLIADREIYRSLAIVRARSRERAWNDDYARKIIRTWVRNIIGPHGFKLQVKAREDNGTLDKPGNARIEEAWKDWAKQEYCTTLGTVSFREAQKIMITGLVRDGEFFIRKIRSRKAKYGFRMQLLEPELLDERYNMRLDNGNVIKMGVEVDAQRRPVAYHFRVQAQEFDLYDFRQVNTSYERVPADQVIHCYDREYVNQTRGLPVMMTALWRLKKLSGWEEAALTNALLSASKHLILRDPTDQAGTKWKGDAKDDAGNELHGVEPGIANDIGHKEVVPFTPNYPDAQHEMFVNAILRGIGSGSDVAFETLANNREKVNYSSIRAGLIEEREGWKEVQEWFIDKVMKPIYSAWLREAMLTGEVNLPFAKLAKFDEPQFTGKRWAWVDPLKDIEATKAEIAACLISPQRAAAERGMDLEELLEEIADARKMFEEYKVTPDYGPNFLIYGPDGEPSGTAPADAPGKKILDEAKRLLSGLVKIPTNGNGTH